MSASQVRAETNQEQFRWGYRKKGKDVFNVCRRLAFCITLAGFVGFAGFEAAANPTDGTVVSGSATISGTGTSTVTINQTSNKAIIEWGNFDINAGETTQFIQPGTSSLALNRVVNSNQVTAINGNLTANGKVLVINPNGVLIGATGNIDVAGFVASTADIDNTAFMTGTGAMEFNKAGKADASVENNGRITIRDAGLGLLVAPVVRNNGLIEGNLAKIQLGAGDTFGVDMYGDGLLHLAVSDSAGSRTIKSENTGTIVANAGKVVMTAAAASSVVNSVINTTGVIEAKGLVSKGGEIILTGAGASVTVAGKLDASGKTGGGSIKIGGDFAGSDALAKANTVDIAAGTEIKADATDNGDGGSIAVWSETATTSSGAFSARGGANGGNGGFVETSAKDSLQIAGTTVDTSAPKGSFGTWLLDPTTYTLTASEATWISAALSNVSISTTDAMTIAANVNMTTAGVGLSLTAGTDPTKGGGITMANQYIRTNGGDVTMNAGLKGAITINNATIFTQGGNVSLTGKSIGINNNAAIGTRGGNVTLTATGTSSSDGVDINSSSIDTTAPSAPGIGTISLLQDGVSKAFFDVFNSANSTVVQTTNGGNITIIGKKIGKNSVCFAAGGPGCTVADPIPSIALTITAPNQIITYGSTLFDTLLYSVSSGALMSGDSLSGNLTRVDAANWNAGTYGIQQGTVGVISTGSYTYTITWNLGNLIINPAILTITAQDQSKTYGSVFNFTGSEFSVAGLQFSDTVSSVSLASAGAAGTAGVGSYAINASSPVFGTGIASNYNISYVPGTFTVDPALLTLTANNQTKTYGSVFNFTGSEYSVGGTLFNSDSVTGANLSSAGAAGTAGVGSYDIDISGATGSGLGNYTISYVKGNMTVDPALLTLTANNQTKTYGSVFSFTGSEYSVGGTLFNSDSVTGANLSSAGAAGTAGVGSYDIGISGATGTGLSNYNITYVDGTLTVDPALLTLTANNQTKTYGSVFSFTGSEYSVGGTLFNSDSVTGASLSSAGAAGTAGVGSYDIGISGATGTGLSNYNITYVDGTLTVDPALLTLTANNQTKTYGSVFSFTGSEYSVGGTLFNSDSVTGASLSSAGAAGTAGVGSYDIDISGATGSGLGNYTISYVKGNMTVDPALLTLTANNQTKTYGSVFSFTGSEYSVGGTLFNSDSVTGASLSSAGAAGTAGVGSYDIGISGATGTGLSNYNITYVDGTLTVDPALLTLTANNQTKTYGSVFSFTGSEYSVGGTLFNSDSVTGASLSSAGAAGTAGVGSYDIGISGATGTGLSNYNITYVDGTLTVDPALLTLTANNQTKTYGSVFSFTGSEYSVGGTLFNSDSVTGASLSSAGAAGTAGVGSYDIGISGATGSGLGNYTISYVKGNMTVNPALLTLTANNQTKTYGSVFNFAGSEYSVGGTLFNGDDVTSVALSSAGSPAPAAPGTYAINIGKASGTGLSNYDITYVDGTMVVNAAPQVGPNVVIAPIDRPIISVANQAIVLDRQFEQIEVKTLDTNVAIGMQRPTAQFLANLEPAAGGEMTAEELAKMEPAAGPGVGGASGNADIACANDFLNNQPCAIDQ